ncbi:MAG: hypothetical protein U0Y10_01985 [Spirosomataceae bacterium]
MKSRYYQAIPILRKLVVIKQGRNNSSIETFLDELVNILLPILIERNDGEVLPTIYNADEYLRQNLPILIPNELIKEEQVVIFIKELMILVRKTVMDLLPSKQYNFDAELAKLASYTFKDFLLGDKLLELKRYTIKQHIDNESLNNKILEIKLLDRKSIIRIRFFFIIY